MKGIVINKFHGDADLFQEGVDFIESYTGIRVAGVIPHMMNHGIEEEDMDRPISEAPAGTDVYDTWAAHVKAHVDWPFIMSIDRTGRWIDYERIATGHSIFHVHSNSKRAADGPKSVTAMYITLPFIGGLIGLAMYGVALLFTDESERARCSHQFSSSWQALR